MFDVNQARLATLDNSLVGAKTSGRCARSVRSFLERGGLSTVGRPVSACKYVGFLPSIGFAHIKTLNSRSEQSSWTSREAQVGDISVMNHGVHGHICMFDGVQWVSDFRQNNMWPYVGDGTCFIFRYTGEKSSATDFSGFGMIEDNGEYYTVTYKIGECPEKVQMKGLYNLYRNLSATFSGNDRTRYTPQGEIVLGGESPSDTGISAEMFAFLCEMETGRHWGFTMGEGELSGKDLGDAGGHRTFGYGSLYFDKNYFMDEVKQRWSQEELESVFIKDVQKRVGTVQSWASHNGVTLTQHQLDAIVSACYNFGDGFLKKPIARLIVQDPNNPEIKSKWTHLSDKQGKKYPGLLTRRKREADWYFS